MVPSSLPTRATTPWCPCLHPRSRRDPQHSQPLQPEAKLRWKKAIYRQRNHVERFFNKLKQFRRVDDHAIRQARRQLLRFRQARLRANLAAIDSFHGLVRVIP